MMEEFLENFINERMGGWGGAKLGNFFLKILYKKNFESRVIDCMGYILNKQLTSMKSVQQVVYDLVIANYIWIVPNGRAEFKRKLISPANIAIALFGKCNLPNNMILRAGLVFDKFEVYISFGVEALLYLCGKENLLREYEINQVLETVKKESLIEYKNMILEGHPLGDSSLHDCIFDNVEKTSFYFKDKYKYFKTLGNISPKAIEEARSWY